MAMDGIVARQKRVGLRQGGVSTADTRIFTASGNVPRSAGFLPCPPGVSPGRIVISMLPDHSRGQGKPKERARRYTCSGTLVPRALPLIELCAMSPKSDNHMI